MTSHSSLPTPEETPDTDSGAAGGTFRHATTEARHDPVAALPRSDAPDLRQGDPIAEIPSKSATGTAIIPATAHPPSKIPQVTVTGSVGAGRAGKEAAIDPVTAGPLAQPRHRRNDFLLAVHLAQRPAFCCCCFCLEREDRRRARRIFRIVRAAMKAARRASADAKSGDEATDTSVDQPNAPK